jgi:excinuclease UvrABC ATPase subunit
MLTVVQVSGSGKSTLVKKILFNTEKSWKIWAKKAGQFTGNDRLS